MNIVWTDLAQSSLDEILERVASDFGNFTAGLVRRKMLALVGSLAKNPRIGCRPISLPPSDYEIRSFATRHSKIYYLIEDEEIVIILIWDVRRNPQTLTELILKFIAEW